MSVCRVLPALSVAGACQAAECGGWRPLLLTGILTAGDVIMQELRASEQDLGSVWVETGGECPEICFLPCVFGIST